ncbi:hypothetical protein L3X38_013401 [Prunus dulcis]|uniref:Proliferating cell nuclear antigen n=1 Tax=Prunus dulcis TaxID=3755 RepID=A0AAD4WLG1_PRUDU|nr:hypothetical protein L3X38_013401 [Prunus dulcis]
MFQLRLDQGAVLLKQAVTPLVEMVQFADIRISPEDLTLVSVSNYLMFPQVFIALRMRSLMFAQFRCNETRWICINLRHFFSALALARSEDSIEIHVDEGEDVVGFLFKNPRNRRVRYSEMALIEVYPAADQMQAGFANFKYQVIVGIPSVEFQRHMIRLRCFGETVHARITDTEVRLSVANEEILLTNENCIIGGDVSEENPVTAVFSLHCQSAIMKASHLTSRVWLLHSNSSLPFCMLNFPVGALGNLMFHFPSPEDGDET